MTMQTYKLITLGAQEMLRLFRVEIDQKTKNATIVFSYDFSKDSEQNQIIYNTIVKSIEEYDECALTYQIKYYCIKIKHVPESYFLECDYLRELLYVDFQNVFSLTDNTQVANKDKSNKSTPSKSELGLLSDEEKCSFLFSNGFTITFKDGETRHYEPFDKSASMARQSRMTFIDSRIKKDIENRLMLGINLVGTQTVLSKLYAYRGLYLTAARRIERNDEFPLDEETVIVIDDSHIMSNETLVQTAYEKEINNWESSKPLKKKIDINAFDGEGLICPEYSNWINSVIYPEKNVEKATTFQMRLPFTKGVLHEVDFHSFAREFTNLEQDDVQVKDVFGRQRSLKKARIVLTKSMFKCFDWLSKCISDDIDPMAHFFDKCKDYQHALYIGNTDLNLSNHIGRIKLNYQFLNTLQLDSEEFKSLLNKQPTQYRENVEDETIDNLRKKNDETWNLAYQANHKGFRNDPKIVGMINGVEQSMLKDYGLGRIVVSGECRFISRDLLALLIDLVKLCNQFDDSKLRMIFKSKKCLWQGKFFMPNANIKLDSTRKYGILRNPHLSRNEQCLLSPYIPNPNDENNYYTKYFSHLSGVVMVAYKSLVPMALSGCDFDGDLVKIVAEKAIRDAIKKGVYDDSGDCRELPIIEIPSKKPKTSTVTENVDYETVRNTFSSQVGYISNLAIKFGKKEYFEDTSNEDFKGKCAECTIVTGLEIDAAKTGNHPNLDAYKKLDKHNKDYFLERKEKISSFSYKKGYTVEKKKSNSEEKLVVYYNNSNQAYLTADKLTMSNIDYLPYRFIELLDEHKRELKNKQEVSKVTPCFKFEVEGQEDKLEKDLLLALSRIIRDYKRVLEKASLLRRTKEKYTNSKFSACVYNLLTIKYDDLNAVLVEDISVKNALDNTYAFLDETIKNVKQAKLVVENIILNSWQFVAKENRKNVLYNILSLDVDDEEKIPYDVLELLTDFRFAGYKLLYYIAKDVWCKKGENYFVKSVEESTDAYEEMTSLYRKMEQAYLYSLKMKETGEIRNRRIIDLCRKEISNLFDSNMYDALKYAHSLRSSIDKSGSFFWSVFSKEEILRNVYVPQKQKENINAE